jgi:hypothetical protein
VSTLHRSSAICDRSNGRCDFKTCDKGQLRDVDMEDFDLEPEAPRCLPSTQPYPPPRLAA